MTMSPPHRPAIPFSGDVAGLPTVYRRCDDPDLVCHGVIYAFPIWEIHPETGMIILYAADPRTGQHLLDPGGRLTEVGQVAAAGLGRPDAKPLLVWDYVGQTIRDLEVRAAEHMEEKCWADVAAGPPIRLEEGEWKKAVRDHKEIAAIHQMLPRFNHEYSDGNPQRIGLRRQIELRHARDDALGRERWLPLEQRTSAAMIAAEVAMIGAGLDGREPRYPLTMAWDVLRCLTRWVAGWRPVFRTGVLVVSLWCAAVLGGHYLLVGQGWQSDFAWIAAVAVTIAVAAAVTGPRRGRRKRRRRRR
jgi:hypothetical protein